MGKGFLTRLIGDRRGSMAIETAIVAPVLATLALGSFEVGSLVSRQHELQTAASEGESIALVAAAGATVQVSTLEDILETSMGLEDDQVTVALRFRCNDEAICRPRSGPAETSRITDASECDVEVTYTLQECIPFVDLEEATLTYNRPILVVDLAA